MEEGIFRYLGWLIPLVVVIANGLIWRSKSKKFVKDKPELQEENNRIIKGWFIYASIPFLIVGFGTLTGLTKSMFDFYDFQNGNIMMVLFWVSLLAIYILGTRWMFFQQGAEKLLRNGFIVDPEKGNEKFELMKIKGMWLLILLGAAFGILQYNGLF